MNDVVEMLINEKFDDVILTDNYKVKDVEVFDYIINDDIDLQVIVMNNRVIFIKKDDFYDRKVIEVCNNDDEIKELLNKLYD